jgi:hypothetical protein
MFRSFDARTPRIGHWLTYVIMSNSRIEARGLQIAENVLPSRAEGRLAQGRPSSQHVLFTVFRPSECGNFWF